MMSKQPVMAVDLSTPVLMFPLSTTGYHLRNTQIVLDYRSHLCFPQMGLGSRRMATLSELVDTIAAVEDIDPATVALMARYIREAGLISTGGRGPSAATMSLRDAANLLIGVNATTTAVEAARTVSAYRELEAHAIRRAPDEPRMKYGTLGEAIEQLIHAIIVGELPEIFLHQEVPYALQYSFREGYVDIALKFRKSDGSASARIARTFPVEPSLAEEWLATGVGESIFFAFYPPRQRGSPRKRKNRIADRIEETTIGYRTLSAVGKLLVGQDDYQGPGSRASKGQSPPAVARSEPFLAQLHPTKS
jgi:hypothetical protein